MFYVAKGRIYSTAYDPILKGYPEYAVYVDATGVKNLEKTGGAMPKKPAERQVCILEEVYAQFAGILKQQEYTSSEASESQSSSDDQPPED